MIREFGYEYDAVLDDGLWRKTRGKVTGEKLKGALTLRSGRDALKAIAREYEPTVALLPALSCDSMVLPFTMSGHEVRYYKLNPDYSADTDSIRSLIKGEGPVLFLYMDYFGNTMLTDDELSGLRKEYPDMVFIEDRTHNLLYERTRSFEPEYIMASIRKWCGIPDGGLLWDNKPLRNDLFSDDVSFSETRLKAQCMRHVFLETGDESLKTEYRMIFSSVSDIIDEDKLPGRMSLYAYEMINRTDFDEIRRKRAENAGMMIGILKKSGFSFIQSTSGKSDLYVPVIVNERDDLQCKLAREGIFCTVIWLLTKEQKDICKTAGFTEEHLLAVYCDQRMTTDDMRYIAKRITELNND